MRTRNSILVSAGVAAALVVGTGATSWGARDDAGAPDPDAPVSVPAKVPVGLLAAMTRDLGLSVTEARERLTFQEDATDTQRRLERRLGDAFAGAWLDAGANELHVAVTEPADAAAVRAAGATAVVVEHSQDELDAWKAALDRSLRSLGRSAPSWYVDVAANEVVVNARAGAVGEARRAALAAGVPAGALRVVASSEAPRTLADVIGGNAYYIGGARCSVGFSVQGGFVTAGHCGRTGNATTSPSGTFAGSSFPGNDYAWVRVASGSTPVGAVNNYAGGTVAVAGSTAAAVGASVCRSGSTTGWHCGTIQALNSSVTYAEGTVSGLIRTNVCAEPGDSGGSLLAGNQAQGMTSGGSGNCTSGGTTYFQPVNEALSAFGLTLVTSSGGGTTPPPAGCTGHASTYTGSLGSGGTAVQPSSGYVTLTRSGSLRLCLQGPTGTDYDLYLQRWSGSAWSTVASATTASNRETVTYSASTGSYRYVVRAYSGSGAYTLGATTP